MQMDVSDRRLDLRLPGLNLRRPLLRPLVKISSLKKICTGIFQALEEINKMWLTYYSALSIQLIASGANGLHGDLARRPAAGELKFQRGSYSKKPWTGENLAPVQQVKSRNAIQKPVQVCLIILAKKCLKKAIQSWEEMKSVRNELIVVVCPLISVDCKWGIWTSWAPCTMSCGGGIQRATRVILVQPQYGGRDCVGGMTKEQSCNTNRCPCFFQDVFPAESSTQLGWKTYDNYDEDGNEEYENANKTAEGCQELCQVRDYVTC